MHTFQDEYHNLMNIACICNLCFPASGASECWRVESKSGCCSRCYTNKFIISPVVCTFVLYSFSTSTYTEVWYLYMRANMRSRHEPAAVGSDAAQAAMRSFSNSASWSRFCFALRFWNQIFTWNIRKSGACCWLNLSELKILSRKILLLINTWMLHLNLNFWGTLKLINLRKHVFLCQILLLNCTHLSITLYFKIWKLLIATYEI